jgi:CheY-like chemotaxis protein
VLRKIKGIMNSNLGKTSRHILVVEDYLDSQEITCELLRLIGHTVQGVGNAEDALAYLDGNAVDVLLTDINLPKMSGLELAAHAMQKNPELQIIFASGHAGFDVKTVGFNAKLLSKPFDLDALTHALNQTG